MFAKKAFILAFLSLSLSASAAPAADCTLTQTVTARSAATSAVLANTGGKGGNKGGNAGNAGGAAAGGNNAGTGAAATGAGNNNNNNNNNNNAGTGAAAAGAGNNNNGGGGNADLQTSLSLDPTLVQTGFAQTGQTADSDPGQVASVTSENNFINFCATTNLPLTNGTQIKTGSCNAAPMGIIAATTAMPSSKFVFPANLGTIQANTNFTVQMAINNLNTGFFVNPNTNYFSAPQATGNGNLVNGHSHVVIEAIDSLESTTVSDPTKFNFFKGFNAQAQNGILTADVAGGLPAGTYKMSSMNTAANHQPVLVAVAQHGSLDDAVYFTVTNNGGNTGGNNNNGAGAAAAGATAGQGGAGAAAGAAASKKGAAAGKGAAKATGKGKRWLWE